MANSDWKLNLLVCRQAFTQLNLHVLRRYGPHLKLMIDCGAYIDYTHKNQPWPIQRYNRWVKSVMAFIETIGCEFDCYLALDVIGDGPATRYNYEAMLDAGLTPVPIVTRGATDDDIQRFVDTADKIAVGGIFGGKSEQAALKYMIDRLPADYPQHWLGFTNHDFVCYYKPTSVDSSSWTTSVRWGHTLVYLGGGKWHKVPTRRRRVSAPLRRRLRAMGFDPAGILHADNHKRLDNQAPTGQCITCASFVEYTRELEYQTGVRYYLAMASSPSSNLMMLQRHAGGPCFGMVRKSWVQGALHRPTVANGAIPAYEGDVVCVH